MKQLLCACILCALLFTSCADSSSNTKVEKQAGVIFKKSDYGDKWPFAVEQIEAYCAGEAKDEIYLRAGEKVYALNGSAQRAAEGRTSKETFETFKAIWLDDPKYPGTKMPMPSEFISKAQEKCDASNK